LPYQQYEGGLLVEDIEDLVDSVLDGTNPQGTAHLRYLLVLLMREIKPRRFIELSDRACRITTLLGESLGSEEETTQTLFVSALSDLMLFVDEDTLLLPVLKDPETKEPIDVVRAVEKETRTMLSKIPEVTEWEHVRTYLATMCGFESWEDFIGYVRETKGTEDLRPLLRRSLFKLIEGGRDG
jgi:hypothetical protein